MGSQSYGNAKLANATLPRKVFLRSYFSYPYRNPTQVDNHKYGKVLERTLLKELGKMTP